MSVQGQIRNYWTVYSNPAAGVQATITKAAAVNTIHVITGFYAFAYEGISTVVGQIRLLLDVSVIWQSPIIIGTTATAMQPFVLENLAIFGTENTSFTFEFTGVPSPGTNAAVSLTGYTIY